MFSVRQHVMWRHCDSIGIVFAPRFGEMLLDVLEQWLEKLHTPHREMIFEHKVGFPARAEHYDYRSPASLGDELQIDLRIVEIGASSVKLRFEVTNLSQAGRVVLVAEWTRIIVDLNPEHYSFRQAVPIPEAIRQAMTDNMS